MSYAASSLFDLVNYVQLGAARSESLLSSRDKSSDAATLTGQVGTALYASPEINDILLRAVRYSDVGLRLLVSFANSDFFLLLESGYL